MENKPEQKFILLHARDNTVTALVDLASGDSITLGGGTKPERIIARQDIPYAHKFARSHIAKGDDVLKYGEIIGVAVADIRPGEHVHVHNVESKRAKGEPA